MTARTTAGKIRKRVTPGASIEDRLALHRRANSKGCWIWTGCLSAGYGVLTVNKKRHYAHRLSWETFIGPIPEGMQVDHLCRNRACHNPDHLEPVTPLENTRRGMSVGAKAKRSNTCNQGHARDVWGVADDVRTYCRLCRVAYLREYNARKRCDDPGPIDVAAIFRSRRAMKRLGLVDITPDDILDNTPGRILASHRYPSLIRKEAA